jgi:ABC-type nitrate/sulfonate/bicarbonate transport system substrate-binding protein
MSPAAQTPTVKLTLDFSIQGQQSPFVLAAEGGYFARREDRTENQEP